jgi:hypothetical protein
MGLACVDRDSDVIVSNAAPAKSTARLFIANPSAETVRL